MSPGAEDAKVEHVYGDPLTEKDFAALERGGIPRSLAREAVRRVDSLNGAEMFSRNGSGDYAGQVFLYTWPGEDRIREYRLRRDHPDLELGADGEFKEKNKYVGPPGRKNLLYFAPRTACDWLEDATLPVIITEGEKKTLALSHLAWHQLGDASDKPRWLAIGLGGVNNWKGTTGKQDGPNGERLDVKGPIPDLGRIQWSKREVIILFDSNVHTNEDVRIARNSLAKELRSRGAHVLFVNIPREFALNGIDDVIGQKGPDVALGLIRKAYDPKEKKADLPTLTEERLAQEYEARYQGEMHYDHHRGRWYHWSEEQGRWLLNEKRLAFHFARQICRSLNTGEKKEFARARVYGAVEQIAQTMPTFAVTSEQWDSNIWLLGTADGTVDLRTGKVQAADKNDFITKQTSVAPNFDAPMPLFTKFLDEITKGDADLQRYLKRLSGYSFTGSTEEQKLFFLYGPGGNGKSVLVNTLDAIAGDYAKTATMEAFIAKRGEPHTTDIAMLAGARLVTASETQKGRRWDEALIGRLTGGDPITARFMRRDNFTYTPQFTLIIVGNHAPSLSSVNEANRRRFAIIPFTYQPPKRDKKLFEKLKPEWGAILAWVIQGAVEWYAHGLGKVPQVVKDETEEYFEAQDDIQTWVEECCLIGSNFKDSSQHLYASYEKWCKENGVTPGSQKELISTLKQRHGCKRKRRPRGLIGICVKVEYEPDPRTGEREE